MGSLTKLSPNATKTFKCPICKKEVLGPCAWGPCSVIQEKEKLNGKRT